MFGFGLFENIIPVCTFGFLFFLVLPVANNCMDYLARTNIPADMQGRVWGLIGFISQLGYVVSYAVSGVLADALGKIGNRGVGRGSALLIIISGLCLTVFSLGIFFRKNIKSLEHKEVIYEIG
jgi:sulfite exporter TauE/SafE